MAVLDDLRATTQAITTVEAQLRALYDARLALLLAGRAEGLTISAMAEACDVPARTFRQSIHASRRADVPRETPPRVGIPV